MFHPSLYLPPYVTYVSSKGTGETVHIHRLVSAFVAAYFTFLFRIEASHYDGLGGGYSSDSNTGYFSINLFRPMEV